MLGRVITHHSLTTARLDYDREDARRFSPSSPPSSNSDRIATMRSVGGARASTLLHVDFQVKIDTGCLIAYALLPLCPEGVCLGLIWRRAGPNKPRSDGRTRRGAGSV
jgi:hypothetical protein